MRVFLGKTIVFAVVAALFTMALAPALAVAAPENTGGTHCDSDSAATVPGSDSCLSHCQLIQCRLSAAGDARAVNINNSVQSHAQVCFDTALSDQNVEVPSPEIFSQGFAMFIVIQGIFAGLATGKMAEGSLSAGLKHSVFLTLLGYGIFSIAVALF